jgi:hypothetical protein
MQMHGARAIGEAPRPHLSPEPARAMAAMAKLSADEKKGRNSKNGKFIFRIFEKQLKMKKMATAGQLVQ